MDSNKPISLGTDSQVVEQVEVIIVTYNGKTLLQECLNSIRAAGHVSLELRVTVVDNDSTDGTVECLAVQYPEVRLIQSGYNAGFSKGNNVALREVKSQFVLLLNPDTLLSADAIPHLLSLAKQDPMIGVLGCRLQQRDGSFDHAAKRSFPSPKSALKYFFHIDRSNSNYFAPEVNEFGIGQVDAVNGAFMLLRKEAIDQVGYLDEAYWMYGEDLDWCRRFGMAGWKVFYDGRVTVTHVKAGLSGRVRSPKLNWHFHRSMAVFYKTYDSGTNLALDGIVYAGIFSRMAYFLVVFAAQKSVLYLKGRARRAKS